MDLLGRQSRALLESALAELRETRAALAVEQSKRIAAESLADSYRRQAEFANDLARTSDEERRGAVKAHVDTLVGMNRQLIDSATPKEDPRSLEHVRQQLAELPRRVNSTRRAFVDADRTLLQTQIMKPRSGNPEVDRVLEAAQQEAARRREIQVSQALQGAAGIARETELDVSPSTPFHDSSD